MGIEPRFWVGQICAAKALNLYREERFAILKSAHKLLDTLADRRCRGAKVQTLFVIQGGAPRLSDEDNEASILRHAALLAMTGTNKKTQRLQACDKSKPGFS